MQGTRVEGIGEVWDGDPGSYYPVKKDGEITSLWFRLPTGTTGRIANKGHGKDGENEWTITENPDGTITVDPSIEQPAHENTKPQIPYWHGHLVGGEWRG